MKTKLLFSVSFIFLLGVVLSSAQAPNACRVNVPFAFTVERTSLPAGDYEFKSSADGQAIQVIPIGKGKAGSAVILTRLAASIHTTQKDAHVVFDKIGETYILSELWLPGVDGFLLHATKEKHQHKVVNAPV